MGRVLFHSLGEQEQNLIVKAMEARERAYAPISKFQVGAAILSDENEVFTGVNVEISSFSPTICAERNAIFSFYATGARNFRAIAIYGTAEGTYPCGVCRQVIYELSPNCKVFIIYSKDHIEVESIADLLPHGFRWEEV
ncbi:MAG: cytidine deaminase [Tissierellia bacterium]|nr:cytidine deaminase [Tissierellia bacterium]